MTRPELARTAKLVSAILPLAVAAGCATVDFDRSVAQANRETVEFTGGKLTLAQTDEQRRALEGTAAELLRQPLDQASAVQLALVNSPAFQAMLAENWARAADEAQSGRIANPLFTLSRIRVAGELEIERALTFGLLDLLTLPQRYAIAQQRLSESRLQLTAAVVDQVTLVRQAWIKAVAAQQALQYSKLVFDSAEASAELARRMQAAGNFTKLARARQQVFYADAVTQWSAAQLEATTWKEQLIRLLGLTDTQARSLVLPERLPDLPAAPRDPAEVSRSANAGRLDVRIARSAVESVARAQGLGALTSFTDIELGVRRETRYDGNDGHKATGWGYEVSVRIPAFDWGDVKRETLNAQTLAAANRLEATVREAGSRLRHGYSAYRTTYDIARHYRDEIVPLRKTISEENTLRYNGMLIGVFELLADSREQIRSVLAAIAALERFWLADAALRASIMGKPVAIAIGSTSPAPSRGDSDATH